MERSFTLIVLFAALIAALGFVPPLMLATGIPVSAQSLGVMLAGTILGARRGAAAVILVVAVVALGLPILAGGRGGLGVFVGPSVGFILGWIAAAYVAGLCVEKLRNIPVGFAAALGAISGGIIVLYLCGTVGMMIVLHKGFVEALLLSSPFVPGDLIKTAIAAWLTATIARYRPGALLSRAQ